MGIKKHSLWHDELDANHGNMRYGANTMRIFFNKLVLIETSVRRIIAAVDRSLLSLSTNL